MTPVRYSSIRYTHAIHTIHVCIPGTRVYVYAARFFFFYLIFFPLPGDLWRARREDTEAAGRINHKIRRVFLFS